MFETFASIEQHLVSTGEKLTIALAGASDEVALRAIVRAHRLGIADAILLGNAAETAKALEAVGGSASHFTIIDEPNEGGAAGAAIEAVEDGLAEPREFVTRMRGEVDALGAMIDDLFELARLDAGDLRLDVRVEPAAALVERALERARVLAGAKGVQVSAAVAPGTASVCCAPEKVDRVLDNLLANAVRHTPSHGRVTLGVEPCGDEVQLTVEDSGEGLSNETLTRMFDHFWRGDASRRRDGAGAGLGLAIARGLVEAQGGRIWAENRRPSGARVVFTLPAGAVSGTPGGNHDEPAGAPLLG